MWSMFSASSKTAASVAGGAVRRRRLALRHPGSGGGVGRQAERLGQRGELAGGCSASIQHTQVVVGGVPVGVLDHDLGLADSTQPVHSLHRHRCSSVHAGPDGVEFTVPAGELRSSRTALGLLYSSRGKTREDFLHGDRGALFALLVGDLLAADREFCWPPARNFVAAYRENLMAADALHLRLTREEVRTAIVIARTETRAEEAAGERAA